MCNSTFLTQVAICAFVSGKVPSVTPLEDDDSKGAETACSDDGLGARIVTVRCGCLVVTVFALAFVLAFALALALTLVVVAEVEVS
ncbi:unnamed protein product [Soboliphyme baturini]|uniref:Secreted protein n=1 Tax=Soboliphyme baturini TaxID=241478 RepID=A0A183IRN7_9BILA|nr:unnamed protein product [Soboliphyme baturini]